MGGPRARCLESSFDVLSCPDLFRWIGNAKTSGALCVGHDAAVRRIYFADGGIVACSSNEPRLQLGPYLIAHGWIDDVALKECMRLQDVSGRTLGSLLVDGGKISAIDLQTTVTARAEEMVFGLFDWPSGIYRFEADIVPPNDALRLSLSVQEAVLAAARRQGERDRVRNVFHSPHVVVQKVKGSLEPPAVSSYLEGRLYEAIDGKRTLAEIAQLCRTSEHVAGLFLLRQAELGLVHARNVHGPKIDVVDGGTALREFRELMATGEYEAAVEWIDRFGLKPDGDEFLAMLIAKAEAGFLANVYRTQVPPDAVPRRVRPDEPPGRTAGTLTSDDLLLLDLVDGHWDVRSLAWIAPLRKIDVVRGLLRLRKHGCIELPTPRGGLVPSRPSRSEGDGPASEDNAVADIERAVGELGA